jgi:hypothetical protein
MSVADVTTTTGEIREAGIRYILMRPDVLMGVAHELAGDASDRFLKALEISAFKNVQDSFRRYQASTPLSGTAFLQNAFAVAARLGWGSWSFASASEAPLLIDVANSPFAAAYGKHGQPVCAPIAGVLRAAALSAFGEAAQVTERSCAVQGARCCRFEISF